MEKSDYIRVTQVLAPYAGYGAIPKEILEKAADRGTRTHGIINSLIKGLGAWDLEDDIRGYVKSAEHFLPKIEKVHLIEERMFDDTLKLTGQCDLVAEVDGEFMLIDWKTSSKYNPTWPYQGGAYYNLINGAYPISRCLFIKLDKGGGEPEIFEWDDENLAYQKHKFLEMLHFYKIFFTKQNLELFE